MSLIQLYNGEVSLELDEKHRYWVSPPRRRVESVTQAIKVLDKSYFLVPWAAKMVVQKLARLMPRTGADELGYDYVTSIYWTEFEKLLLEAKSAPRDKLEDAGDIGTAAHGIIERAILTAISDGSGVVKSVDLSSDDKVNSCVSAALAWMEKHNVRWVSTEELVYSKNYDYAGTLDGIGLVDSCDDKKCCPIIGRDVVSLIDWKSSNQLSSEYLMQTAAYEEAKIEMDETPIADRWILRLGKEDGAFEGLHLTPDDFAADLEAFLCCLNLFRANRVVDDKMKKMRKSRGKKTDWLDEGDQG